MASPSLLLGVDSTFIHDIESELEAMYEEKISMIAAPLFHPRFRRDAQGISNQRTGPGTRSDRVVSSRIWTTSVVGKISPWIDLDSTCEASRCSSEQAFEQEVAWADHLSVSAIMTPTVPTLDSINYAANVQRMLCQTLSLECWIPIRLTQLISNSTCSKIVEHPTLWSVFMGKDELRTDDDPEPQESDETTLNGQRRGEDEEEEEGHDERQPWTVWSQFRTLCDYPTRLGVVLEITENIPCQSIVDRWLGEPIKAVVLPLAIFLTNKKGFPTLSSRHQQLLMSLFLRFPSIPFLFQGLPRHHGRLLPYTQYMHHLFQKHQTQHWTAKDQFESPYYDYLQAPLQPLMDNLESQTYETFEQDPVKYRQYQRAIEQALRDFDVPNDDHSDDNPVVVMVVGAGRGPLVRAALAASERTSRRITVFAIEKNPNAVMTLRNLVISENWTSVVTVVASDMRDWITTERADILVSELLGSFGDNELSPECLDGAERFLKPDTGISIPCHYTSYVTPVSSSKCWNAAKSTHFPHDRVKALETPYVVKLHQFYPLGQAQVCFEFHHPRSKTRAGTNNNSSNNDRQCHMTFPPAIEDATIHGFAGYFEATLYGDHSISIHPPTFSEGMFSWFPIFFPLRVPQVVAKGQVLESVFWRKHSSSRVWYEWMLGCKETSRWTSIHNPSGRSYWIGL